MKFAYKMQIHCEQKFDYKFAHGLLAEIQNCYWVCLHKIIVYNICSQQSKIAHKIKLAHRKIASKICSQEKLTHKI